MIEARSFYYVLAFKGHFRHFGGEMGRNPDVPATTVAQFVALRNEGLSERERESNCPALWCVSVGGAAITVKFCRKLVESMLERIRAALAAKGGSSRF